MVAAAVQAFHGADPAVDTASDPGGDPEVDRGAGRSVDAVHEPLVTAPSRIRRSLRATFAQWQLSVEAAENALLVIEELVANVVDHARTPFRLTVHHLGPSLRITVRDDSPATLQLRPFQPRAGRGRGLQMIDALTSRWGCDRTAVGKTVWAVLPA
jgi:anti-sigma regulatory factor (Ser/Thr protein kinase)